MMPERSGFNHGIVCLITHQFDFNDNRPEQNHIERRENMAKAQALEWGAWKNGEVKVKETITTERRKWISKQLKLVAAGALICIVLSNGATIFADPASVATIADGSFAADLHKASEPIKEIIFGFAHEIYFVMMAWGGLEALIGKPQQGFARMKSSTAAYVVLFWVPWIVKRVNDVVPGW